MAEYLFYAEKYRPALIWRGFVIRIFKNFLVKPIFRIFFPPVIACLGFFLGLHTQKDIFVICERWNEARDSGFALFKYLRETYPDKPIYYIFKASHRNIDCQKLFPLGNILPFLSLKMFLYLYFARYVASPHTDIMNFCQNWLGKPLWDKKITCFLQHGVIINSLGNYYKSEIAQFDIIIAGAFREHRFLQEESKGLKVNPLYTGLARWDRLQGIKAARTILVMPTWRRNLILPVDGAEKDFSKRIAHLKTTPYYIRWQSFLNSPKLQFLLQQYDVKMLFYSHPNLYHQLGGAIFTADFPSIHIADPYADDLSSIIESSALLVTDFSSVFWDFAYMRRPVIYYQFDESEFRANHWQEGYFSYKKDGFGPVLKNQEDVLAKIGEYCAATFTVEEGYLQRANSHFILRDNQNCERNYQAILDFGGEARRA